MASDQRDKTPNRDPLVGTVLHDRYRVERAVGVGGVGSVYRATQLGLDRRVAVKVLRPELTESRTAMERFKREARTAAKLQHPNIVTVHDFGTTPDGRGYLVMEFLEGLNLAQWIRKGRPTDVARAVEYLLPVCGAIAALHDAGIIHRDIKPSNIMIAEDPRGTTVKVVDFGLVRPNISDDLTDLTGGLVLGTPEFLAPELFSGQKPDERSDVYALGVTAYEAITGELPFGTGSFRDLFHRHLNLIPPRPTLIRPDLPAGVDEIFSRALHKAPARRYTFAGDFAAAIAAVFPPGAAPPRPDPRPAASPTSPETPADERVTCVGTVLLVEDDPAVRGALAPALEDRGFDVTTASDGIEALLQLGSGRFDVVLSDVAMPNLDGIALLRLISEKGIKTPVVLLTGSLSERDERLVRECGVVGVVAKPPDIAELLDLLMRAIGASPRSGETP